MMDYNKIGVWNLGERTNVRLAPRFLEYLNQKIKSTCGSKRRFHKKLSYTMPFPTFKDKMKKGYRYTINLELLLEICSRLKIPRTHLQDNIMGYKTRGGQNEITSPILPIKITPIFDMLLAHHIGDGTVINPEKGRRPYFGYRQFDKTYQQLYIRKIESVFGKINYNNNYTENESTTRIYSPVACSELMFKAYGLNIRSFLSKTARIPEQVFNNSNEHGLAFLIGMIIDDGHVDSTNIVIRLKNRLLIEDLGRLCDKLGFKNTVSLNGEYGYVYINKDGLAKFWNDYKKLKRKFPVVFLGYKEKLLENYFKIKSRKIQRVPGNRIIILKLLSEEYLTINEIAEKILMTRQGVRYHIRKLEKEENIRKVGVKGEGNIIYGLK
jgi:hypothetical protein